MAPADVAVSWDALPPMANTSKKNPSVSSVQHMEVGDSALRTVDELLRSRAMSHPDLPILYYPTNGIQYVGYTFRQLDVFAYRVARHIGVSIPSRTSSEQKRSVIALLGPSNLEYLVTMMALIKLGHTVLFLSTRISPAAIESLMKTTGASHIIVDARYYQASVTVKDQIPDLEILGMPTRSNFEFPVEVYVDTQLDRALDPETESEEIVYIIHSSGSTGLPKPIYQKQKAALPNYAGNMNMRAFITLPLYHNHGLCNWYRAVWSRKSIHMYNAELPLTCDYLTKILQQHPFEIFYGVPYALKLLAESDQGLNLLAKLKIVMYGGSACPDDLGDKLVQSGVNLISHYGATEVGQLMTSFRPAGDNAWNYVREHPRLQPFLRWIPQGGPDNDQLFECCVLPGWPAKTATNQDDGSYRTQDLFAPHPTLAGAWKYIARRDDTLVLVNGEKFNPVVTEGRIRSSPLVAEAVVFGAQQPFLGVLVVPSSSYSSSSSSLSAFTTQGKSPDEEEEMRALLWPVVEAAQAGNDAFALLSRDMVVVLPPGTDYPRTDKGSVIRQAFYRAFAADIEAAYEKANASNNHANARRMTLPELKRFLRGLVVVVSQASSSSSSSAGEEDLVIDDDTDFFALGLDSLRAIQIRGEIVKNVKTDVKVTQNIVFDHPSINRLSRYLLQQQGAEEGLLSGDDDNTSRRSTTIEEEMQSLVDKYSDFTTVPAPVVPAAAAARGVSRRHVVVTGATGSLGAHIVAALVQDAHIDRVYCLVRAPDPERARQRTLDSLVARKLYHGLAPRHRRKIVALPSRLARPDLGLAEETYREVVAGGGLRAVIHAAWSVNFNLRLSSFEKDHLAGVRNLLCLAAQGGASFNFCSSVSAVARRPDADADGPVPEAEPEFAWAQDMGYAQSKSVAEAICARAAVGIPSSSSFPVRVLRLGQIVADTAHGVWNATEAVPLMLQSALTVGALPELPETPSWLPVDTAARGVVEIALQSLSSSSSGSAAAEEEKKMMMGGSGSDSGSSRSSNSRSRSHDDDDRLLFANVTNHRTFDWTRDLLPALRDTGLDFDAVAPREWVRRLRASDPDPATNPPIKLVDFFAAKYDHDHDHPSSLLSSSSSKRYDTTNARRYSPALAGAPLLDSAFVDKFVRHFFRAGAWKRETGAETAAADSGGGRNPEEEGKVVVVIGGPRESEKIEMLAEALCKSLDASYVKASAPKSSSSSSPPLLEDEGEEEEQQQQHEQPTTWQKRAVRRVREELYELGRHPHASTVVVTCSPLGPTAREAFRREMGTLSPRPALAFLDMQHEKQECLVGESETDVYPLDADMQSLDMMLREAEGFARMAC